MPRGTTTPRLGGSGGWAGERVARGPCVGLASVRGATITQMIGAVVGSRQAPESKKDPGDDLFSQEAALSVSSALESLTAVFGMGTGVASPLESP